MLKYKLLPHCTCIDMQTMPFRQFTHHDPINTFGPLHDAIHKYVRKYCIGLATEVASQHEESAFIPVSEELRDGNYQFSSPKFIKHNIQNTFCIVFVVRVAQYNIAVAIPSGLYADSFREVTIWSLAARSIASHYCIEPANFGLTYSKAVHVKPLVTNQFEYPDVSTLIVDALNKSLHIRQKMIHTYGEVNNTFGESVL